MRDILVDHLTEINSFTEGEVESWNFNKQLENALSSCVKHCRTFDHKMNVLAKERVNATPLKIPPYCGSIELIRVLNFSKKSRDMILTEVYFNTAGESSKLFRLIIHDYSERA